MTQAYTPGLLVSKNTRIVKTRELPLPGKSLVTIGDRVTALDNVLEAELPGEVDILRVANRLGLDPDDVLSGIKVKIGDHVEAGDTVCELKTFFGLFTSRLNSPYTGTVEFFTGTNAHLGIRRPSVPLNINAYIDGVVTRIEDGKSVQIESDGAMIQGIFGVGGESRGKVLVLDDMEDSIVGVQHIKPLEPLLPGAVLIGGKSFDKNALEALAQQKIAALVTGSIDSETLDHFVGHQIGVSITGDEDVPFTLIITEGFGSLAISERVVNLAKQFQGQFASVNGATQVRAGAVRPEIIISSTDRHSTKHEQLTQVLQTGAKIRIIRVPYFGELGTIIDLPPHPVIIQSGAKVRVLKAKLNSGKEVIVPRANVELV